MSSRASPIKHQVKPTDPKFSDKILREGFSRGKGARPKPKPRKAVSKRGASAYFIQFFFRNNPVESKKSMVTNATGALRDALSQMRTPEAPFRAKLRRLGK